MFRPTAVQHNLVSARIDISERPELAGGANV
jgi:hypothetical protein